MKARYFYDKMLQCMEDTKVNHKYHHNYSSGMIQIHHKGNESEYFTLYSNGDVKRHPDITSQGFENMNINVLETMGDDFELFNTLQVLKAGYLIFDIDEKDMEKNMMKMMIYRLYTHIFFLDSVIFGPKRAKIIKANPDHNKTTCNKITYLSKNEEIRVDIKVIDELCGLNKNRREYDLKAIPFNKSMSRNNSIHVTFSATLLMRDKEKQLQLCEEAIKELIEFVEGRGLKAKFRQCKMGASPVYF